MNRREAIAALVALPGVTRIAVAAPLAPADVIVIECSRQLSDAARASLCATLERVWPGRRCLVLDQGFTLKIAPGP